jgi:protocatechuate 3,4-dioxygenase beta subunit
VTRIRLSRRDLLWKCAALGSLTAAPGVGLGASIEAWDEQENAARRPTPWNEIGPFYKRKAPNNGQLRTKGDPGLPLTVTGRVLDSRANAIPNARIEIWQADHFGKYDLDGYRFRATLVSEGAGKYSFESVMPGHYPARVGQHIHYLVTAPGHKPLTTQLYFATDPAFDGDPAKNFIRDPLIGDRELVRPVTLTGDPKDIHAAVSFEIVLERA